MGVSFKVAKAGTRYRPKPLQIEEKDNENGSVTESQQTTNEVNIPGKGAKIAEHPNSFTKPVLHSVLEDLEVSFSLNLFGNGFSIGKDHEFFHDEPNQLHPYDRASETLFSAIEFGCLPGDLLDDIPCKYVDGALLCEIRDYRNPLSQRGGTAASMKKPSIVHKVLLQMCTENVVKDISLMSDDSWTYEELLEIESRILKALQPALDLNPEPLQDRCYAEPQKRKLNFGVARSWKQRKLSDTIAITMASNAPYHETQLSGTCDIRNSSPPSMACQDGGVTCLQQKIWSSNLKSQGKNVVEELTSEPNPLTALTKSNVVRVPDHFSKHRSDSTKFMSPVSGEKGIPMKPKQEPVDFSQQQLPGSQSESILAPEPWKNALFHQQILVAEPQGQTGQPQSHSSLLMNSGQPILEGIPRLCAGMPIRTAKQEPAETNFYNSDVSQVNDNCFRMDRRIPQFNLQQLEKQRLSPLSRANTRLTDSLWNHVTQPVNKSLRNECATPERKALWIPQVSTRVRSGTTSSQLNDSLAREASVTAKQKTNSQTRSSNLKSVSSFDRMHKLSAAIGNSLSFGNLPSSKLAEIEVDPVLGRLLKIEGVTQRYGLNNSKHKSDQFLQRKPFFHTTHRLAHLLSSEYDRNSKNAAANKVPSSMCSIDRRVPKTRTLTFVRQCHFYEGDETPRVDRETQITLFIAEKLGGGTLEAFLHYGDEEENASFIIPLFFSTTHAADIFASQFTSLMVDEGYHLATNRVEPGILDTNGASSSQASVVTPASLATQIVELPAPLFISGPSPLINNPRTVSLSAHNATRLPSQNILSRLNLLNPENIRSALQLSGSCLSKSHLDVAAPLSAMQWQEISNKHALLQLQMQQWRRQQELVQGKELVGGLGVTAGRHGMIQPGGGIQGLGNVNVGSFSNITGMGGSMSTLAGGCMPWIDTGNQFNNLSHMSGSSESKQLLSFIPNHPATDAAKLRTAETNGGAFTSRYLNQRDASGLPMAALNSPGMACNLNNQPQPQLRLNEQLHMLQQQEDVKPLLQPQIVTRLARKADLTRSQFGPRQM